jgi:hypothetical protein
MVRVLGETRELELARNAALVGGRISPAQPTFTYLS